MTKEEFLARCANAYDMGLVTPERMSMMERWLDVVMREGHSRLCAGRNLQAQWNDVREFWVREEARLNRKTDETFGSSEATFTLANDADGYAIIVLAAILGNSCQQCAVDPQAWHTRGCMGHCTNSPRDEGIYGRSSGNSEGI
jgi:hypothetical protein